MTMHSTYQLKQAGLSGIFTKYMPRCARRTKEDRDFRHTNSNLIIRYSSLFARYFTWTSPKGLNNEYRARNIEGRRRNKKGTFWCAGLHRLPKSSRFLRNRALLASCLTYGLLLLGSQRFSDASEPLPPPWIEDAALHDLACPDPLYAWAVGDQGAIWHTDDGGAHWRQQVSGVRCALQGVWFVDRQIGWVVGGQWRPCSDVSYAVVLRTDDGGNSWQALPTRLPALRQVQFFDPSRGIAWGHGSSSDPAGLFTTDDGGRSWRSLGDGQRQQWLGGHFVSTVGDVPSKKISGHPAAAPSGMVVGRGGRAAQLVAGQLRPLRDDPFASRPLRDVTLLPPTGGWLVGDGGLVLHTSDLGHSWQTVPALSEVQGGFPGQLSQRDFHTVAARDNQVWLAGNPGTHVLHSPDGGQTWQQQPTECQVPIHRVRFVNSSQGWAVGSLGTILATGDGGQTWHIQRQGGQRIALLGLFATADHLPLLTLAKLSCEEGYRIAVHVLFEPQTNPKQPDLGLEYRLRAGLSSLHINSTTAAWQFSLPTNRLRLTSTAVASELNRRHDGQAAQHLLAELVRQIRLWRPEAVLVPHGGSEEEPPRPLDTILRQAVLAAVQQAADPTQQIDQITRLGLAPWQVQRVVGWLPKVSQNTNQNKKLASTSVNRLCVNAHEIAYHHDQTLGDLTHLARDLLDGTLTEGKADLDWQQESEESFLVLANRRGGSVRGSLLSGLNLTAGGAARRRPAALPTHLLSGGGLGKLRKQAERQRNLRKLLQTTPGDLSHAALLTQVARQADSLNQAAGSALLHELALQYRAEGQLDRSADMLQRLIQRSPHDPLAEAALRWLVSYYASGEAAHTSGHAHARPMRQAKSTGTVAPRIVNRATGTTNSVGQPAVITSSFTSNLTAEDRLTLAVQWAKAGQQLAQAADPAIRWPQAVAQRKRGFAKNANRTLLALSHRAADNPWQACAQAEAWLARPGQDPPRKPIAHCPLTEQRPDLDGRLDEALWETARSMRLTGGEWMERKAESGERKGEGGNAESGKRRAEEVEAEQENHLANVWVARDDAYLYLAIRCAKVAGVDYMDDDRSGPRDGDLSGHDRIRLLLDIDRDYGSYYELTIDARGWTADCCFGNTHWNPQWFVAAGGDQHTWTAEAAIPLGELVSEPVQSRHVWAVAVDRVVPGAGLQSWAGPVFEQPGPENFGLLIFD
jgi:photosystem II stability/assembly factor-like uncharacterized protein